jgi:hypothetical protein
MVGHSIWTTREEATPLLAVLQEQAVDIPHSIPTEARYEDNVEVLEDHYGVYQLPAAYCSHLKAMTQLSGESLQEFAATIEQLAHWACWATPALYPQGGSLCIANRIRD